MMMTKYAVFPWTMLLSWPRFSFLFFPRVFYVYIAKGMREQCARCRAGAQRRSEYLMVETPEIKSVPPCASFEGMKDVRVMNCLLLYVRRLLAAAAVGESVNASDMGLCRLSES
jgi:hypothetical protein